MTNGKSGSATAFGWFTALLLSALLAGCGGDGDGGGSATTTVSGRAASGTAVIGGTVQMVCAGSTAGTTVTTTEVGGFIVTAPGSAPCVIRVSGGTVNGVPLASPMYSVFVSSTQTNTNVNQLTTILVGMLAGGNPETFFTSPSTIATKITAALVATHKATIIANVVAILGAATGTPPDFNFLETTFTPNHTAFDKLLDNITFTTDGSTTGVITFKGTPPVILLAVDATGVTSGIPKPVIDPATSCLVDLAAAAGTTGTCSIPATTKAITAFSFVGFSGNPGVITEGTTLKTIAVTLPSGTPVTALTATYATTGSSVTVAGVTQTSGAAPTNNFTSSVDYIVTAADGSTATYTVTVSMAFVDPLGTDDVLHGTANGASAFKTIQYAISRVLAGDTIQVAAGTYTEVGQIVINKNLTIVGADKTTTIIKPAQDTGDSSSVDARGWFLVPAGITFNLSNVTLDGTGKLIYMGLYYWGNGTVNNCIISNIKYNESGPDYQGRGMIIKGNVNVTNSTFTEMGRIGIQYFIGSGTASGNTFTGKGVGNWLDYGFDIGSGAIVNVQNNTISNNKGVAVIDGSGSAAVLVTTYFGPGTTATITGNILINNSIGIAVGVDADTSVVVAHSNTISGNTIGILSTQPAIDAENNWWGFASGPSHATLNPTGTGNAVSDYVDFTPWLTVAP